ncbi:hypothetical protein [Pectobacterium aquaticum]|uniref:hypothetical protein n=1 Tax=Pectobacterium aquaticum TaxID=2204145 RepID=UPI001F10B824|nr:hypothetical protein [Pectobacterium aquaticum]MCH5051177.1 hypothetical protein [Pectobacterium aquaticum]
MARNKSETTDILPDANLNPEIAGAQQLLANVQGQINDERDLLNQLLGQAQMADAFGKFSQTVWSSKLAFVKENKLYRELKGKKSPNGLELSGTWQEFCELLGVSDEKANQDIANLLSFGEEALESMSRMGIGYRELRQFRRLPEDQKSALIEVAKDGDKTALLELAEEMIAKHAKEKEDLKIDLDISRQTVAEKKEEIDNLKNERDDFRTRLTRRAATETPDTEGVSIETEVAGFKNGVMAALVELKSGFNALADHTQRTGIYHIGLMAGIIDDLQLQLTALRNQFDLPEHRDDVPDWVKESQAENVGHDNQ